MQTGHDLVRLVIKFHLNSRKLFNCLLRLLLDILSFFSLTRTFPLTVNAA